MLKQTNDYAWQWTFNLNKLHAVSMVTVSPYSRLSAGHAILVIWTHWHGCTKHNRVVVMPETYIQGLLSYNLSLGNGYQNHSVCGSSQSHQANTMTVLGTGHGHFLPSPFQLTAHRGPTSPTYRQHSKHERTFWSMLCHEDSLHTTAYWK
jgi:hypothetical protein